jgi:hypothetical protein
MFKCLPFALLGAVMFLVDCSEAQLFRRFAAPRAPAVPSYRPAYNGQQYAPQRQIVQPQQATYYRRVQVAPGRFALVPVQGNGAASQPTANPQDIARKAAAETSVKQAKTPAIEGPQTGTSVVARTPVAPKVPTAAQQTQQRYRRVTVYNTRTGQRSTRLIPIPSATLTQQPYVYGQNRAGQGRAVPKVVTGTLVPPAQAAGVGNPSSEIRLDSQVQPASLVESSAIVGQPQVASPIPLSPEPQLAVPPQRPAEPQPAIATPLAVAETAVGGLSGDSATQHSVLVFDEETSDDSAADIGLELSAPAN